MKKTTLVLTLALFAMACSETNSDIGHKQIVPAKPKSIRVATPADELKPVEVDLSAYIDEAAEGAVRAYVAESRREGPVTQGKIGDYVLENAHARYLIEAQDRSMSPCPWGGNLLDASRDGGEDILGEICLFLNAGQTLKAEKFDFIDAGPNVGVLAVTGHLALGDYINIVGVAGDFLPSLESLPLDPDDMLPLTVTVYYILHGDSNVVRMVTAMRNDGDIMRDVVVAHLVVSGGDGRFFNPLSSKRGFGATNASPTSEKWPFVGFVGTDSSYLFGPITKDVPLTDEAPIPAGGAYLTISGVAAVATGITDIIQALTSRPAARSSIPGIIQLEPGDVASVGHYFVAGDGSLATSLDELYPLMEVPTQTVSGTVLDSTGNPAGNVLVTAARQRDRNGEVEESTMNQIRTGADGTFSMKVPLGDYRILARRGGTVAQAEPVVSVSDADISDLSISLTEAARVTVTVKTPAGDPTPARVTVICDGGCDTRPTPLEQDIATSKLPGDWAAIEWLGMDGAAELELAPGAYKFVVSRGFEWSTWPSDAVSQGGHEITLNAGDEITLDAEIAHVLDTSGALSADFHVHSVPSPDSAVPQILRTLNFLAEGVDVIVSTDHDVISDFAPEIASLGAQSEITSLVGAEITTSDTGHFNAFPLQADHTHRRGGALDWSQGEGPGMEPADIFGWAHSHPGEQVVQINHPTSMGLISTTEADVLRGITYVDRAQHRLAHRDPDPVTGDTGLWSETFTAMELMTGSSTGRFWGVSHWWLTMIGRGFSPTGTAVTDTHKRYGDLGGSPRSYVFLPDELASPLTFDSDTFTAAVNAGNLVGSGGPFVRVSVQNSSGDVITLGETISNDGDPVTVTVDIQTPEWFTVNSLDVFSNLDPEDVITPPGETVEEALEPTRSIDLPAMQLVEVSTGDEVHRRHELTYQFEMDSAEDAYVVMVISGDDRMNVVVSGQKPFAFTNPFFIDADGSGYDNPPYAELASTPPTQIMTQPLRQDVSLDEELVHEMFEAGTCHHH